jgi:mutator protein MutT
VKENEAGAVVIRRAGSEPRILLVTAKDNANHWLFPKGHIERGESAAEAARREVEEEAGIVAKVTGPVGSTEYEFGGKTIVVEYFMLAFVAEHSSYEGRKKEWLSLDAAERRLSFETTRIILRRARSMILAENA